VLDVRDFDAIALAYNAAAAQVAAAFAERQLAETPMRQFVADAGHELRTPLTIVLGYIDLLLAEKMGPINDRQRQCLQVARGSGKQLLPPNKRAPAAISRLARRKRRSGSIRH